MKVSGIIFDCDGTVLDSMSIWGRIFNENAAKKGVVLTPDVREVMHVQHLASKSMRVINDWFGFYEDSRDYVTEFYESVYAEYAAGTPLIDGVREFVEEVRAAKIPYLIASGTRSKEVWAGLRASGIDDLFMTVLSCEDLGVGKNHPFLYRYAQSALGVPKEETWVFEDEPCGLITAKAEGYRTVCIFNDHDGRDPEELKPYADVFSVGFRDVSLELLRSFE
ncbi:MAG: HAD family phosphatase [Atopobiaceae bacterium]|nr:HAD family phosphatase [Atopobiaceae bacterium]